MATSPNYGWLEPDNTDLVKNGALAIRTLGNAIDTTMATMTPKSIVDAKGDLIAASANDTPARLAVGNNGETLVADSSTSTGLRYTENYAAGKNAIINGAFNVWQRGTSFTVTTTKTYTADRFASEFSGTGATRTVSQQTFTPGAAPVAGYESQYFLRYNRSVAGTSPADYLTYRIEDARTFAGQTVTISYWAKAASAMSLVDVTFYQEFGSGGSATVTTSTGAQAITTSWVRYTTTLAIPSVSGKTIGTGSDLAIYFALPTSGTFTFDIWGVQVEDGSVATAFQTATGTLQGELAACQRYYQKTNNQSEAPGTAPTSTPINAINASTTLVVGVPPFKGVMRVAPTVTLYSSVTGTTGRIRSGGADVVASAADVGEYAIGYISATGLVAGSNSTIAFAASAEL